MKKFILLIVLMLVCGVANATDYCADANNVGCFLMEDDGNETDRSANYDNTLTETSGDIPQSGDKKFGTYSRDFEAGDTEYLTHDDGLATDINGANAKLSVCLWVKMETTPSGAGEDKSLVSKYDASTNQRQYQINIVAATNKLQFALSNSSADATAGEVLAGDTALSSVDTWFHICAVYDDTNMMLYVDGNSDGSVGKTDGIYNGSSTFKVGATFGGGVPIRYFDGLIDDVGIFSRDLSSTEINDIMDNGLYSATVATSKIHNLSNMTITSGSGGVYFN